MFRPILLGLVEGGGLHLLRIVVGTVGSGCHHASHPWDSITRLWISLHLCRSSSLVDLGRIHVVSHTIRLISDGIGLTGRGNSSRES